MGAEENFEKVIIGGKVAIIFGLLALCFANGHKTYVNEKPRKFIGDCVAAGLSGALAFTIIAYMRNRADVLPGLAISSFLLLFMFNVLCEFAGFNSSTEEETGKEKAQKHVAKWPIIAMAFLGVGALTYFAYKANVPLEGSNLLAEAAIFGLLSGIAQAYTFANHGEPIGKSAGLGMVFAVLFGLLHVAMQKGGFYENMIFLDSPPCIS
jgi:hypothetical protein